MGCILTLKFPSGKEINIETNYSAEQFNNINPNVFMLDQLNYTSSTSYEVEKYNPRDQYDLISHIILNEASTQEIQKAMEEALTQNSTIDYISLQQNIVPNYLGDSLKEKKEFANLDYIPPTLVVTGNMPGVLSYNNSSFFRYTWNGEDAFIVPERQIKQYAEFCKIYNALKLREEHPDMLIPELVREGFDIRLIIQKELEENLSRKPSNRIIKLEREITDHINARKHTLQLEQRALQEKYIEALQKEQEGRLRKNSITPQQLQEGYTTENGNFKRGLQQVEEDLNSLNSWEDDYIKNRKSKIEEIKTKGIQGFSLNLSPVELLKDFLLHYNKYSGHISESTEDILLSAIDSLAEESSISSDFQAKTLYSLIKKYPGAKNSYKVPLYLFRDYFAQTNVLNSEELKDPNIILSKIKELFIDKQNHLNLNPLHPIQDIYLDKKRLSGVIFQITKPLLGQQYKWNLQQFVDKLNPKMDYEEHLGQYIYKLQKQVGETIIDTFVVSKKLITPKTKELPEFPTKKAAQEYINKFAYSIDLNECLYDMSDFSDETEDTYIQNVILPANNYYSEGEVFKYLKIPEGERVKQLPPKMSTLAKLKSWIDENFNIKDAQNLQTLLFTGNNVLQKASIWASFVTQHPSKNQVDEYNTIIEETIKLAEYLNTENPNYYYVIASGTPKGPAPEYLYKDSNKKEHLTDVNGNWIMTKDTRRWHTKIMPVTLESLTNIQTSESSKPKQEAQILLLKAIEKVFNRHGIPVKLLSIKDVAYQPEGSVEGALGLDPTTNASFKNGIIYLNYENSTVQSSFHEYTHLILATLQNSNENNYFKLLDKYSQTKLNFNTVYEDYVKLYGEDAQRFSQQFNENQQEQQFKYYILEEMFADDYSKYLLKKSDSNLDDLFKSATEATTNSTIFDKNISSEQLQKEFEGTFNLFEMVSSEISSARKQSGFNIMCSQSSYNIIRNFINKNKSSFGSSENTYIKEKCD